MSDIEAEIRRQMLEEQAAATAYAPPAPPPLLAPRPAQKPRKKGLAGALGAIGVAIAKFWAVIVGVLIKFKVLLVALKLFTFAKLFLGLGSMVVSMFAYSLLFGWKFAVGFVLLIFIHECGHALAAHKLGHPTGIMLFVPFMGALVTIRQCRNAVEDAFVGIMGPVFGTLGGIACCLIFAVTRQPFWLALASINFWMNLLNLTPSAPLDGGWIAPLFSPKLLLPGVVLLLFTFGHNPMVWVLAIMSIPRILFAWKHANTSSYFKCTARDRLTYGLAWAGLAVFLAGAGTLIHTYLFAARHIVV